MYESDARGEVAVVQPTFLLCVETLSSRLGEKMTQAAGK